MVRSDFGPVLGTAGEQRQTIHYFPEVDLVVVGLVAVLTDWLLSLSLPADTLRVRALPRLSF